MRLSCLLFLFSVSSLALAHSGRTDVHGCHHDRKRGGYHCHNGRSFVAPANHPTPNIMPSGAHALSNPNAHADGGEGLYFSSCVQAWSVGRAPLQRGQEGYRAELDRDDNGVACDEAGVED